MAKTGNATINFTTNGGSATVSQTIKKGNSLEPPADPVRDGYIFGGWYVDGKPFDFSQKIDGDITLVAKWIPVINEEDKDKTSPEDKTSTESSTPTKTSASANASADTSSRPLYRITFDSNGGSKVPSKLVRLGYGIIPPQNPTKTGYKFLGWYFSGKPWVFYKTPVRQNMTLVAQWAQQEEVKPEETKPEEEKDKCSFEVAAVTELTKAIAKATPENTICLANNFSIDEDLNNDKEGSFIIQEDKSIVLDLNSHKITNNANRDIFYVKPGGTLKILDSTKTDSSGAESISKRKIFRVEGELIIENGHYKTPEWALFFKTATSNVIINGGTFDGPIGSNGDAREDKGGEGMRLTITGGKFNKIIYLPGKGGVTNIKGGEFTPKDEEGDEEGAAIEIRAGDLNISGGKFVYRKDTTTKNNPETVLNTGKTGDFMAPIVIGKPSSSNNDTSYASPIVVKITGDTTITNDFNAQSHALAIVDQSTEDNPHSITVTIDAGVKIVGEIYQSKAGKIELIDNRS